MMAVLDDTDESSRLGRRVWISLCASLALAIWTGCLAAAPPSAGEPIQLAQTDQPGQIPPDQAPPDETGPADQSPPGPGEAPPAYAPQTPEQLQQLVAPIALYPDPLVAQVLTASTFPEQVVEADRWLQGNSGLTGQALADAANQQPWDPSVKALTAFPAVLGNMDRNLSWTSSLGDAYYNQPQDVMNAVQEMRQRAEAAGNLESTPQQAVTSQDNTISIEPANPGVVYVPAYNPWVVYGGPVVAWPGWYPYPGVWFAGPYLTFGVGLPIAVFGGFAWGWSHWGFRWPQRQVLYGGRPHFSQSTTFFNRGNVFGERGPPGRPAPGREVRPGPAIGRGPGPAIGRGAPAGVGPGRAVFNPGGVPRPFNGNVQAARGFAEPHGQSGMRSGAFSGYNPGGQERSFAARGAASFSGGPRGGSPPGGGPRGGGPRGSGPSSGPSGGRGRH